MNEALIQRLEEARAEAANALLAEQRDSQSNPTAIAYQRGRVTGLLQAIEFARTSG